MMINTTQQQPHASRAGAQSAPPTAGNEPAGARQAVAATGQGNALDMTNISRADLNNLVKAGTLSIADLPLLLPEGGVDLNNDSKHQLAAIKDERVNVIAFIEGRIDYRRSIAAPTDREEAMLNKMLSINAQALPKSVDAYA